MVVRRGRSSVALIASRAPWLNWETSPLMSTLALIRL
jgi:hypothetical protein